MDNPMTDGQKKQRRMAAVFKARSLGLNNDMIKFGVHLKDNLGAMNRAGVCESHKSLWYEMIDALTVTWTIYESITNGFTIDEAVLVMIAQAVDGDEAKL